MKSARHVGWGKSLAKRICGTDKSLARNTSVKNGLKMRVVMIKMINWCKLTEWERLNIKRRKKWLRKMISETRYNSILRSHHHSRQLRAARYIVSDFLTLKPKNLKNLKTFLKNVGFFPGWYIHWTFISSTWLTCMLNDESHHRSHHHQLQKPCRRLLIHAEHHAMFISQQQ